MLRSLFFIVVSFVATSVFADTTLTYNNSAGQPVLMQYLTDNAVRIEDRHEGVIMIYNATTDSQILLYPDTREYIMLTSETVKNQMGGAMAQLQAQMDKMPPEQQAMMKNMMGSLLDRFEPAIERGAMTTVAGYECQQVKIMLGSELSSEVCLADPADVGVDGADYAAMKQMMRDLQAMLKEMLPGMGIDMSALDDLEGVPVRITEDDVQKTLATVSDDDVSADLFTVPEGYTRKNLTEGTSQ